MPRRKKSKVSSQRQRSSRSSTSLARAFDQCPVVLFSLLTDKEAVNVACAVCIPQFLSNKHYVIKQEVSLAKLLQGVFPCTANKVSLDEVPDRDLLAQCPSTVKSMTVRGPDLRLDPWELDVKELPRSLTELTVFSPVTWLVSDPGWPPLLSNFTWWCPNAIVCEMPQLPSSLRMLRLSGVFSPIRLPSQLQELDLWGTSCDAPLSHPTLQKLTLPQLFNHPVSAKDLPSLRVLSVGSGFNHPLDDLPSSLTYLILSPDYGKYRHALDRLPASLKRLELNRFYNLPLNHLPSSLSSLCISSVHFNQPLDHLPNALSELGLSKAMWFNQPLDHLPQHLQVLKIGVSFNHPLESLPPRLTYLEFNQSSQFSRPLDHLPSSLHTLILHDRYKQPLDHLPPSLRTLRFSSHSVFNRPLNSLPDSLSRLCLGDSFNQPFLRLPRGLTHLQLGDAYNQPLYLTPPHFTNVVTRSRAAAISSFQAQITSYPDSLRVLHLGRSFNQPLGLPSSLTELVFHRVGCFSQRLPASALKQLVVLVLPHGFGL